MNRGGLGEARDNLKTQFLQVMKKRLHDLRRAHGQTIQEVAESVGATRGQYNQWELGNVPVPSYYLKSIANYFGTTVDYLVGEDQPLILGPLETVIKELQKYEHLMGAGMGQTRTEDIMLEELLRAGKIFVDSTASSIYLVNDLEAATVLSKILAIGYREGLTAEDNYSLEEEPTAPGQGKEVNVEEELKTREQKKLRTTVKVFLDGTPEVKRSPQEIGRDFYRGSHDKGCGSYLIVPLWTMDADRLGVVKFENHVDDNPSDPFNPNEIVTITHYLTVVAEFLRVSGLCVASRFRRRNLTG